MARDFDGAKEPMRAIRDLILLCESGTVWNVEDLDILERAQAGFTALRKLSGDDRPAEDIEAAAMIEPRDLRTALQFTAATLQTVAPLLPRREDHVINFTGKWMHLAPISVRRALDLADDALSTDMEVSHAGA